MSKKIDYWADLNEGFHYHIYNRSINKENIFVREDDINFFLKRCRKYLFPFMEIQAYCLMQNHFHFLVKVNIITEEILKRIRIQGTIKSKKYLLREIPYNDFLVDQFKRLFQSYAKVYNSDNNRNGSLFQKRFKRILIKTDIRWSQILTYVHHNPIHHNFRKDYHQWKYSSYNSFINSTPSIVHKESVFRYFDDNSEKATKEFINLHKEFKLEMLEEKYYLESFDKIVRRNENSKFC